MKRNVKVRFNLSAGENFMKWKIMYRGGLVQYIDPTQTQLIMKNCVLKNSRKTAEKIFNGNEKVVCAWVLCEEITIHQNSIIQDTSDGVFYNPRKFPYWVSDSRNTPYYPVCLDGCKYDQLHTKNNQIYITK